MTLTGSLIRPLGDDPLTVLSRAATVSPHLERLARRREAGLADLAGQGLQALIANARDTVLACRNDPASDAASSLRRAKADTHLAVAMGDLSGTLELEGVTGALSDLADVSLETAIHVATRACSSRDRALLGDASLPPGLTVIAMGKHGARELNYSSDIDPIAFVDRDLWPADQRDEAVGVCVRIVGAATRLLEDITAEGYVFRVDWRLRPDPSSTPLVVSVAAAESYYEAVGQNWERAAMIKARPVAGDLAVAQALLGRLRPFVWRKYLDFAAVADVQSILRQIHAVRRSTDLDNPSFDVKLGRGGIREIEFFVQTQQLILGGRDPALRTPGTLDGLAALAAAGRIDTATAGRLSDSYTALRMLEHRIQMLDDEQTHLLPADDARRARVATLCGQSDIARFDRAVKDVRETVRGLVRDLFPESTPLSAASGSLVFTGVDDDPETLATLAGFGFSDPKTVAARFREWHRGVVRATRAERSREILTRLTPALFEAWAATGEPDLAFSRFDTFLSGIPAGVQVLSLLEAQPAILRDTCATLGLSSRLALQLTRRPALLDSMLGQAFESGLSRDQTGVMRQRFDQAFSFEDGFEGALDAARRVHREEMFRIGHHVLHGRVDAGEGGRAFTGLADATLQSLLPLALADVERVHGGLDARVAVFGWGKLGGRELSADSDLDIMIAYDVDDAVQVSDGPRPVAPQVWVTRLAQRLITALSAQTAEGSMYDVDMQLRPSGNAGPVAVQLSALRRYYAGEAWTWELQALTRLRPVAGDPGLGEAVMRLAADTLARPRPARQIIADVVTMRARMASHQKPRGPFDIKRQRGGLIDLEFITQACLMLANGAGAGLHQPNTGEALAALAGAGMLAPEQAGRLGHVAQTYDSLRQTMAVLGDTALDLAAAPEGMRKVVARALGEPDFVRVRARLDACRIQVETAWAELEIKGQQSEATETGP